MISSLFLLVQKPLVRKVARKYPRASREPMPTGDDDADFIFPGGTVPKGLYATLFTVRCIGTEHPKPPVFRTLNGPTSSIYYSRPA